MYNINLYSYWKKPFSRGKNFTIHPLDEPGKEKYYSDQSHCVHYLKRTDPFVFKSILGVDYETLVRQQKEDIALMNQIKQDSTINQQLNKNNEDGKNPENSYQTGAHINRFEEDGKNGNETINNNYNKNNFNSLRNYKSSSTINMRPYNKERDFKAIYGYDNITSFKSNGEKYLYAIENMKKSNLRKPTLASKRYDGFTVYDAPIIEKDRKSSSLFKSYNDKMTQSLKCIDNSSGIKAMNEEEMRNNLFNQTSQQFLKKYHLPDIIKIADSRQVIRKQRIGLSKEMGEKYNPYSLIAPSKNRTGRNYVGDLFKH
jgi:hypothetical protein